MNDILRGRWSQWAQGVFMNDILRGRCVDFSKNFRPSFWFVRCYWRSRSEWIIPNYLLLSAKHEVVSPRHTRDAAGFSTGIHAIIDMGLCVKKKKP